MNPFIAPFSFFLGLVQNLVNVLGSELPHYEGCAYHELLFLEVPIVSFQKFVIFLEELNELLEVALTCVEHSLFEEHSLVVHV